MDTKFTTGTSWLYFLASNSRRDEGKLVSLCIHKCPEIMAYDTREVLSDLIQTSDSVISYKSIATRV